MIVTMMDCPTSVARNLKSLGVAIEDITKATGLSADEIAEL